MSVNRVIYRKTTVMLGNGYTWVNIYGDELLNFIDCYDEHVKETVKSWRKGERRLVLKDALDQILACFPLDYTVEYA